MDLDDIMLEVSLFLNKELYDSGLIDYSLFFYVRELLVKKIEGYDI